MTPWAEKYRPTRLEDCVLPSGIREIAEGYVRKGECPHLLFSGKPGTGKTTLARVLAKELDYSFMIINASDEGRLLDTLRTKIRDYASSTSISGRRRMILLDEADNLPADTIQPALRAFMEEFSDNCTFVLTCNKPNRIIDAIHSRTARIEFISPEEDRKSMMVGMSKRIFGILDENSIEYDKKVVAAVVKDIFPNFRKMLNTIQQYAAKGNIDVGVLTDLSADRYDDLVTALRNKRFNAMREWVAKNPDIELYAISRYLWENSDIFVQKESLPQMVLTLADYQFKDASVADKEINSVAMLTELMMELEFTQE